MTKEEVMILIDKRIEDTKKKGALFPDNSSYYIGVKRPLKNHITLLFEDL